MVKEKILPKLAPFIIGLLLIELGLFCYSLYDPTMGLQPFPYRDFSYFLLVFGAVALVGGTLYQWAAEIGEDETSSK